jgi:hypothetical protein
MQTKKKKKRMARGKNNEWGEGNDTVLQRLRTGGAWLKVSPGK